MRAKEVPPSHNTNARNAVTASIAKGDHEIPTKKNALVV
jgi:hypothetical protein